MKNASRMQCEEKLRGIVMGAQGYHLDREYTQMRRCVFEWWAACESASEQVSLIEFIEELAGTSEVLMSNELCAMSKRLQDAFLAGNVRR